MSRFPCLKWCVMSLFTEDFAQMASQARFIPWLASLLPFLKNWEENNGHGDFHRYCVQLSKIADIKTSHVDFSSYLKIGNKEELPPGREKQLKSVLKQFEPWRKGPYEIFGITLDSEWRSDYKWDRLKNHISSLEGRCVLDVGCGNGYHLWRMKGSGAGEVFGIDPCLPYLFQFKAVYSLLRNMTGIHYFPMGLEDMPRDLQLFDTVFSMGVIYHQKSPFEHLEHLYGLLRPEGELVLETLVVNGDESTVLTPRGRYARMGNVWFIPSVDAAVNWLLKCGFKNPRVVDVTVTEEQEQHRSEEWGCTQSLMDFLDPRDHTRTVEGYEAPKRAIIIAEK